MTNEQGDTTKERRDRWWTSPRMVLRRILLLEDSHHSIALGTTIGMFMSMTPTVGFQMILIVLLAAATGRFFRFNRVAALLATYVSNPVTVVPIYYIDYRVGAIFFSGRVTWQTFVDVLGVNSELTSWEKIRWLCVEVGAPLIVGSIVVATIVGLATYPLTRWMVRIVRGAEETAAEIVPAEQLATSAPSR